MRYDVLLMNTPQLTNWTPWSERTSIEGANLPGVYLMAHFDTPPNGPAHPTDPSIVYIGETCLSLAARWRSFDRSIKHSKRGHSGGLAYHARFCTHPEHNLDGLFVAAIPIELDEPHASALIRHIERQLIWDFVQKHDAYPVCNSK